MADDEHGDRPIPSGFLAWVEKPLQRAMEACQRVPMRRDEHRAWLEVWHELRTAQDNLRELHKLGAWMDGQWVESGRGRKWKLRRR